MVLLWWILPTSTSPQALLSGSSWHTLLSRVFQDYQQNRENQDKTTLPKTSQKVKSRVPLILITSTLEVPFPLNGNSQPTKYFLLALEIQPQEANLFPPHRRVVRLSSYPLSVMSSKFPTSQGRHTLWHNITVWFQPTHHSQVRICFFFLRFNFIFLFS